MFVFAFQVLPRAAANAASQRRVRWVELAVEHALPHVRRVRDASHTAALIEWYKSSALRTGTRATFPESARGVRAVSDATDLLVVAWLARRCVELPIAAIEGAE